MAASIDSLDCSAFPPGVDLLAWHGVEALNELYTFTLSLRVPTAAAFDLDRVVGERATLHVRSSGTDAPMLFHGILVAVDHLQEISGHAILRATLVPQLWHAGQGIHSQVFVEQSIPDILSAVLTSEGLGSGDFRLALRGTYPALPHVCQYHESNLAFMTRWLEREGMYFFFEQGADREVLVITDDRSTHTRLGPRAARYVPGAGGDAGAGDAFREVLCQTRALPGRARYRDYDPQNPKLDVSGSAAISPTGRAELNIHGANFATPSDGERLARLKAEELRAKERIFRGHGRVFHLRPGYTFGLEEHPHAAFNVEYLVTSVEHHGNQAVGLPELKALLEVPYDDVYRADVVAIPATVQFRPEHRTPVPRIYGMEMAIIDGASASPYAQLDASGRYKVKIDFDEADASGGKASTWVRMLQPHGGGNEGFHFPLRAGTEVMLSFLGGDPDRPVISGVAPNATKASPVTAANASMNVLQSGALNRLEMQDLAGSEHVRVQTPNESTHLHMGAKVAGYNLDASTAGDGQWHTGRNWDVNVGGDHVKHVTGEVARTYDASEETKVAKNKTTMIGADHTTDVVGMQKTTVEGEVEKAYKRDYAKTIEGKQDAHVKGGWNVRVGENSSHITFDDEKGLVVNTAKADGSGDVLFDVKGDLTEDVSGAIRQKAMNVLITAEEPGRVRTNATGNITLQAKTGTITAEAHGFQALYSEQIVMLNADHKSSGWVDMCQGAKLGFWAGPKADVCFDFSLDFRVGAGVSISAGFDLDVSMLMKLDVVLGLRAELRHGAIFEKGQAVRIGSDPAEVKNTSGAAAEFWLSEGLHGCTA